MRITPFGALPAWAMLLDLGLHLAAGVLLGTVYFRTLWWNVRMFAVAGRVTTAIAVMGARLVLLGCLLALASLEGALPLLLMAAGVLIARPEVMRRVREAAP